MSISIHTKPRKSVCRERKGKQMQEGIGRGDTGVLKRSRHGEAVFLAREALLDPGLCPAPFGRPFCPRKLLLFFLTSSFCLHLFWMDFVPLATKESCKRSTFCFLSVLPPTFFFLPNLLENVNLSFSGGEGRGGLFVGLFLCTRLVMGAWPCRGAAGVTPLHRLAKQGAERIRVVQLMMPSQASLALQPVSSVRPAPPPLPCPLSWLSLRVEGGTQRPLSLRIEFASCLSSHLLPTRPGWKRLYYSKGEPSLWELQRSPQFHCPTSGVSSHPHALSISALFQVLFESNIICFQKVLPWMQLKSHGTPLCQDGECTGHRII